MKKVAFYTVIMGEGSGGGWWMWDNYSGVEAGNYPIELTSMGGAPGRPDDMLVNMTGRFLISDRMYFMLRSHMDISSDLNGSQRFIFSAGGLLYEYYDVPVDTEVDALDVDGSFMVNKSANPLNPNEFSSIGKIALRNANDIKSHLFRLRRYPVAIMASAAVKAICDDHGFTGMHFVNAIT